MDFILLCLLTICLETLLDFYRIKKLGSDSKKTSWIIRAAGYMLIAIFSGKYIMAAVLLGGFYFMFFDSSIALVLDKPFDFLGTTKSWDAYLKKIPTTLRLVLRGVVWIASIILFFTVELL